MQSCVSFTYLLCCCRVILIMYCNLVIGFDQLLVFCLTAQCFRQCGSVWPSRSVRAPCACCNMTRAWWMLCPPLVVDWQLSLALSRFARRLVLLCGLSFAWHSLFIIITCESSLNHVVVGEDGPCCELFCLSQTFAYFIKMPNDWKCDWNTKTLDRQRVGCYLYCIESLFDSTTLGLPASVGFMG